MVQEMIRGGENYFLKEKAEEIQSEETKTSEFKTGKDILLDLKKWQNRFPNIPMILFLKVCFDGKLDPSYRISRENPGSVKLSYHYERSLMIAFTSVFPKSDYLTLIEDDLVPSVFERCRL